MKFPDLKHSFKNYTDRGRKKVFKDERRLKTSRLNGRLFFTFAFWAVLAGVVFFAFQSWTRTGFINQKINGYHADAAAQLASLHENGFTNSPAAEEYTKNFVESYINVPADPKQRDERAKLLQGYLAEGLNVEKMESLGDFQGKRVLKSASLYEASDARENAASYVYRVEYELFKTVDKKEQVEALNKDRNGESGTVKEYRIVKRDISLGTKDVLVVIPVGTDGNSFNVVEQPYFQDLPGETRIAAIQDHTDQGKKDSGAEDELKRFASQFFTSYTTNTVQEMSYFMEQPESLKNSYQYKGMEDFIVYDEKRKGQYRLKALVLLQDQDSGLITKQPFTLLVRKQENKFYVSSLLHTIGG
jgi:hypothetical protein